MTLLAAIILSGSALEWNPPETGATPSGYKVYVGEASRSYEQVFDVRERTRFSLRGLGEGRIFLAVTAYNEYGESDFSEEVSTVLTSVEEDRSQDVEMSVFPNPFEERVSVMAAASCEVEVFNVLGQRVQRFSINGGESFDVDSASFASGAYIFKFGEYGVLRGVKR